VIETLLRNDLLLVDEVGFTPPDDTSAQLLFRFVPAARERRSLGIASHWPFYQRGRFLPEHTTAVSLLDRLLHHAMSWSPTAIPTACAKPELKEEPP
jgi:DNA replication protein DnaC